MIATKPPTTRYTDLDRTTRRAMLYELALDVCIDSRCPSPLLNRNGRARIVGVLYEALADHDDTWLATELERHALVGPTSDMADDGRTSPERVARSLVPIVAQALATQLFNRYYARGVCRLALQRGESAVEICPIGEADETAFDRPSGAIRRPDQLIEALRERGSVDDALGVPARGQEQYTVRFPVPAAEAATWRPRRAARPR